MTMELFEQIVREEREKLQAEVDRIAAEPPGTGIWVGLMKLQRVQMLHQASMKLGVLDAVIARAEEVRRMTGPASIECFQCRGRGRWQPPNANGDSENCDMCGGSGQIHELTIPILGSEGG